MFSGIGGFEYGIESAFSERSESKVYERGTQPSIYERSECVGFSEIDKYAIQVYQRHFPNHRNYGNATTINTADLPDFDLLVGGFPCQAFSIAGKRQGFNDTRGTLFYEIARICADKRSRCILLENVKGLLSHDNGKTFQTILGVFSDLGYDIQWQVLNSKNFGVPQNRERVFIVGYLGGECRRQVFPIGKSSSENNKMGRQSNHTRPITTVYAHHTGKYMDFVKETPKLGVKGMSIRRLTPTECERLQGFPDGWTEGISDSQRYKCLGNAVTTNVITEIIKRTLITELIGELI
jgi:DNA (cytosine-5)-methyltransferase 1